MIRLVEEITTTLHPLHIFAGYFTRQSTIDTTEKSVKEMKTIEGGQMQC